MIAINNCKGQKSDRREKSGCVNFGDIVGVDRLGIDSFHGKMKMNKYAIMNMQ